MSHDARMKKDGGSMRHALLYTLAFILPAAAALVSYAVKGIAPFGDAFVTGWDCYTQYVDYFDWFRQVLAGDGNLLYSFGKSMGGNTIGLFAYYLASPLNLLIVFFPEGTTLSFMTILVVIKVGLCGLTASIFLSKRFNLNPAIVLTLACGYALCDYVATFSMCVIMWMEGLILLPLVLLGVYRWIAQRKKALFLVSAAATVYCCWFIAYMVFLFIILFYLYEYYLHHGLVKLGRFLKDLLVFGGLMCVALLLSAFILLPVVYAQLGGVSEDFVSGLWQLFYVTDAPAALFTGRGNIAYVPQICCGTVALFALVLFFFNRNIARRERVATGLFLLLMLGCTWIMLGNEVWNAFRVTRGYYCRFAFLICFLMVYVAGRSFEKMEKPRTGELVTIGLVLFALAATQYADYISDAYYVWVLALVVAVDVLLFLLPSHPRIVGCAFVALTVAEMGINYYATTDILTRQQKPAAQYCAYRLNERALWNTVSAQDDSSFFRLEKTYSRLDPFFGWEPPTNEGMVVGYSQIESYSSCNDAKLGTFLEKMGYSQDDMGSTDYEQPILLSDSLLGIKYVCLDDGSVDVNEYALPIGYAASEEVLGSLPECTTAGCESYQEEAKALNTAYEDQNPFEVQNAFVSMILGEDVECFKPLAVTQTADTDLCKEWTVDTAGQDHVYAYIDTNDMEHSTLTVGDEVLGEYNIWNSYYVFDIGNLEEGQTVKLEADSGYKLHDLTMVASFVDMDAFETAIGTIAETGFEPDVVNDGYVDGTYTATSDTLLFTTIPYDEGWTVTVDGQQVTPEKALDTFLAIPLSQGTHQVTLTFVPQGLVAGTAISTGTLLVLVALWALRRRRRNAPAQDGLPDERQTDTAVEDQVDQDRASRVS